MELLLRTTRLVRAEGLEGQACLNKQKLGAIPSSVATEGVLAEVFMNQALKWIVCSTLVVVGTTGVAHQRHQTAKQYIAPGALSCSDNELLVACDGRYVKVPAIYADQNGLFFQVQECESAAMYCLEGEKKIYKCPYCFRHGNEVGKRCANKDCPTHHMPKE